MVVVYTVRMDELSVGLHFLLVLGVPTFAYTPVCMPSIDGRIIRQMAGFWVS